MPLPADALAAAALVALFGYLVFGITGFGASLFTVPVLSHFLPLPFVLAVALLLDVTAAATLGLRYRRDVALGEIVPLLPFAAIGAVLGVTLLVKLPREACLLAMGIFLLCHGLMGLRAKGTLARVSRWWAAPAGFAGGLFGTLFGVGGPPQIAYLSRRPMGSEQLRATNANLVMCSVGIRVLVFASAGLLFRSDVLTLFAILLPFGALGLWLGNRVHLQLSRATLMRALCALLAGAGVSLIARVLWP